MHEDKWYEKYHRKKETKEFVSWWINYYGLPEEFNTSDDELHEYWVRRSFALAGFLAGKG